MTADVCAGLFLPPSSSGTIRTAGIIILICVTSSTLSGICIIGVLYGESALCSETWRERISNEACVMWVEAINILKALTFSCKWNAPQMASYQFISQDISCLFFVSCFTFLSRFNVCRSLPLHPPHFAPLSRLGGQNVWQEWKNRRETPGLDSTTYIKVSKHPPPHPFIRTFTLMPQGLVYVSILFNRLKRIPISGPLRRYFPQQVFLYLFTPSLMWLCFIHLIFTLCWAFSTFPLLFSPSLMILPLILNFIFSPWCEGLLAQASVNSCQRCVAALS